MILGWSPRRILAFVLAATALVSLAGLAAELARHAGGRIGDALYALLSLSYEANLPTWWSSILLGGCALALFANRHAVAQAGGAYRRHWGVLALVFAYLSLDETAQLHERLNGLLPHLHGVFTFSWIIPAAVFVAVLGAAYVPFLRHLPRLTRVRFIVAGAIYVTGALVTELPLGAWADRHGSDDLGYALIDWVEETLEMVGAALFLWSLVAHLVAARKDETA